MSAPARASATWRAAASRLHLPPGRQARRALVAGLLAGALFAGGARADSADQQLHALGGEFIARWLARSPHQATELGVHDRDAKLMVVTQTTLAEDAAWLRDFRARLKAVPAAALSHEGNGEYRLLAACVERQLLDLEVIRPFERDPAAYLPLLANSVESVLRGRGRAQCARLRLAAQRLAAAPEVLRAARINLRNPPRELTLIAIDRYAGLLTFYRETVPELSMACRDARTQAMLAEADSAAVRAAQSFLDYLREDLLPASQGALAIGPEASLGVLRLELLDPGIGGPSATPSEAMDSLLVEAKRRMSNRRDTLAVLSGGDEGVRAALARLAASRPDANGLVAHVDRRQIAVREFVTRLGLVSLPAGEALVTRPALGVRSHFTLTRLEADGAWEERPADAWLEVTPPDTSWDEARRQLHLGRFNLHEADLAVIHDGLPGGFLRAVRLRGDASRLRRALQATWSSESWGEFCEQMLLDEGYGAGDHGYRLARAARALRAAGRAYVALALHAGVMSPDEARATLETECFLDPDDAAREARRAAADPAVMGYTDAARRLVELRDRTRRALGPRFRIRDFNDAVLRRGGVPVGLVSGDVRRELGLHDGGEPAGGQR